MKKILCLVLICLMITVVGCSQSQDNKSVVTESVAITEKATEKQTEKPTEAPTDVPTDVPTEFQTEEQVSRTSVELSDYEIIVKSSEGYRFKLTVKLSPWILSTNSQLLNDTWSSVGQGNSLPGFSDWGLEKIGNAYQRQGMSSYGGLTKQFWAQMSDMYYCLGSYRIENITENWDFSSSNPCSINDSFSFMVGANGNSHDSNTIGRVFYSSGAKDYYMSAVINMSMTSNSWGPVPFIIMLPENFTPNNPDGENYPYLLKKNSYFRPTHCFKTETVYCNGVEIDTNPRVGVIGKNGEYVAPEE